MKRELKNRKRKRRKRNLSKMERAKEPLMELMRLAL
jgi:hypothetical protein